MEANNSQKLREALERIRDSVYFDKEDNKCHSDIDASDLREICDAALAAPARNCDVGTADGQFKRHTKWCVETKDFSCDDRVCRKCFVDWSQMPYAEGDAE